MKARNMLDLCPAQKGRNLMSNYSVPFSASRYALLSAYIGEIAYPFWEKTKNSDLAVSINSNFS
jgi:hypothetical protein